MHRLPRLGEQLRQLRESCGMSKAFVSKMLKTTPRKISKWENDGNICMRHFFMFCDLVGRDASDVIENDPDISDALELIKRIKGKG